MTSKLKSGVLLVALVAVLQTVSGAVLFDNLGTPLGLFSTSSGQQVGDEIVLAGGAATVMGFSFEYFGSNFSSGESVQVSFYKNDGSPSAGYASPGTLLWTSPSVSIPETVNASSPPGTVYNSLITFDSTDLGGGVLVPGDFTWTAVFTGIGPGESAGPILSSSPPTTGLDYNDYWLNTGTVGSPNWVLMTSAPQNIDFLAQVNSVPEPSTLALFGAGLIGLAGLSFKRCVIQA